MKNVCMNIQNSSAWDKNYKKRPQASSFDGGPLTPLSTKVDTDVTHMQQFKVNVSLWFTNIWLTVMPYEHEEMGGLLGSLACSVKLVAFCEQNTITIHIKTWYKLFLV